MNTTDTATKTPTPQESQLLQSSLLMMAQARGEDPASGPPALSATPTLSGLLRAVVRRWPLALGVAAAAAALTVFAVFTFMPPKFNVTMQMRVVAKQAGADDVEFPIYKANMEALVRNPLVLNAALNDKTSDGRDIKDLDIVRSKGASIHEWLTKNIKTDYLLGPEVLRVTLAADQGEEAAELLNAIARAFFKEYAEMERAKRDGRLDELRKQKGRFEGELRTERALLATAISKMDLKDREAATAQLQNWQNKMYGAESSRRSNEDEYGRAEGEIFAAEARLKSIDMQHIPDSVLIEFHSRDTSLQRFDADIAKIDSDLEDYKVRFNEPYLTEYSTPLRDKKKKIQASKADREAQMKPEIEARWRKNVRENLEYQISVAHEKVESCKLRREKLGKEIDDINRRVKDLGLGSVNEPAQVSAIRDKIKEKEKAFEYTGQKISDVELEPLPSRVIPIQRAEPPLDRDRSQQTKAAGAGGLGIFVLALFGVGFLEFRSRKIGEPDDVSRGLGLNVVGTVPAMPAPSNTPDSHVEAMWLSQLNESVDAIRTVLLHQARTEPMHALMITSANSGEGKTTLATQLAASLARAWKRVLVIDANLRDPATHTLFDVPQEPGLAEVLRGEVEATDAIRATTFSRLWVLPAGNGDAHALQALAQDNVRTLFEQLKQQYDFIIIDAPPVLPVTDSLLIGQHVDGVVYAILTDVSQAPAVHAAQQKMAPLGVRTLGAVVLGT
ncbi:MAG: polysaccharide biosynthesis tyrosine autokinase [Planctomycetes bacterium]|nr:polysaccharide biosynthesis tyrosine autokinase [Planctomycetota bacterium]